MHDEKRRSVLPEERTAVPFNETNKPLLEIGPACDGGWFLRFRYDAEFIYDIKTILPWYARRWDAIRKAWWIDATWLEGVLQLAEPYFTIWNPSSKRLRARW